MNEIALKPSYWASVSGGKDSLYMLNLILHNLDKYPLNAVVHFELEIDFPFIKNVIDYMEQECIKFGIPFYRIKPRLTWEELYNKYHFPLARTRWCNSKYKLDAQKQLVEFMKKQGYNTIFYIGYCVDEERRYLDRCILNERFPLVEENISEDYILNWAKNVPIFNDYYKFNRRCGCMYCPLISFPSFAYLLKYYPNNYKYFIDKLLDSENYFSKKNQKPWFFRSNYSVAYIDYLVRKKYLPLLESQLNSFQISFFDHL